MAGIITWYLEAGSHEERTKILTIFPSSFSQFEPGRGLHGDGGIFDRFISLIETYVDHCQTPATLTKINQHLSSSLLKTCILVGNNQNANGQWFELFGHPPPNQWPIDTIERALRLYLRTSRNDKPHLSEAYGKKMIDQLCGQNITAGFLGAISDMVMDPTFDPIINAGTLSVIEHCSDQGCQFQDAVWVKLSRFPENKRIPPSLQSFIHRKGISAQTAPATGRGAHKARL